MTIRFLKRASASIGAIAAWRSEGPVTTRQNLKSAGNPNRTYRSQSSRTQSNKMEKLIPMRTLRYFAALMVATAATPAFADSSMDAGPVTVTLGGFLASEGVYRSRERDRRYRLDLQSACPSGSVGHRALCRKSASPPARAA